MTIRAMREVHTIANLKKPLDLAVRNSGSLCCQSAILTASHVSIDQSVAQK